MASGLRRTSQQYSHFWICELLSCSNQAASVKSQLQPGRKQADSNAFSFMCLTRLALGTYFYLDSSTTWIVLFLLPWIKERKIALWNQKVTSPVFSQNNILHLSVLGWVWFGFALSRDFRIFTRVVGNPSHRSLCFESDLEFDLGSPHFSCLLFWSDSACQYLAVNRNITLQQINLLLVLVRAKP